MSVAQGQTLVVSAITLGSPTPSVSWYRNGEPLRTGGRYTVQADGSLEIRDVVADDSGSYAIRAMNSVGVDEETINVIVPSM